MDINFDHFLNLVILCGLAMICSVWLIFTGQQSLADNIASLPAHNYSKLLLWHKFNMFLLSF